MIPLFTLILSFFGLLTSKAGDVSTYQKVKNENSDRTIYNFKMADLDGNIVSLADFEGKVLILVNVASKCGLTPQYKDLESFYKIYKESGVEILAFPANNFLSQEPGTNEEIKEFCHKEYGITFPIFSKISVKGKEIDPLYRFLTSKELNGVMDSEVKWNFQKYVIDKNGRMVTFFNPKTSINDPAIKDLISTLLVDSQ